MKWPLLATVIGVTLTACSKKETSSNPSGITSRHPVCKDDTNKRMQGGKLSTCVLAGDYAIGKYICAKDFMLYLHPDGSLKACSFTTPTDVRGTKCKESTDLYPDGALKRCKVQVPRMFGDVEARSGDYVSLYKNGALHRLELGAGPRKIKNLPCKGYFNFFHENGQLKKCELSEKTIIEGQTLDEKTFVCFDEKGKRVTDCKALSWDLLE